MNSAVLNRKKQERGERRLEGIYKIRKKTEGENSMQKKYFKTDRI